MNANNKEKNTHKKNVNRKIKGRHYLDNIEKRKIMTLNLSNRSQPIYGHLIEKYIYFKNENKLNSKEEFYQTYDDIALSMISNLSYHSIKGGIDELIKKGFIARNRKVPEGAKSNIPKYHYTLNFEKLDNIIITPEEYKLPNKKKYEIQQDIKYAHSTDNKPKVKTVEITDNKPKAKTLKSIENDDELVGIGDFEDDTIDSKTDIKTIEPDVEPEILSNDDIPTNPTVEANDEPDKLIDDDISSNKNLKIGNTLEVSTIDKSGNTEHNTQKEIDSTPVIKPDTLSKEDKIINTTKTNEIMKMNETPNEISTNETTDFNERTKLLMKYKDYEGIKPVLEDTRLSFQTINYLYSNEYKKGVDEKLDDKKLTLDILYSIKIEPLLNK